MHSRRNRLTTIALGAVLATTATACSGDRTEESTSPEPGASASSPKAGDAPDDGPVILQLPTGGEGRCMVPTAKLLADQDVAFDGEVTAVSATEVTLAVRRWYVGGGSSSVVLSAVTGSRSAELMPELTVGERYLISADGTEVTACGFSDSWSKRLESMFQRAFDA